MIHLLFGVHAHQPVGNFPAVIDDAHVRCYGMFLRVLEGHPEFRFSVHFSGWLLDVLRERFPDDMARLARMTARGQVEWFGSGDCEPVLAAIPQRDRLSQLNTLSDKIERHFGQRPRGAWLTERVWESSVVTALADTGIRYVAVDDYHFLCAGAPAEALDSYYSTEEDDRTLDLFPISEQLRYRLPFSPASEAVAYLEDLARQGQQAAIYFDDIEKFGIWPETYAWVYEQGWLEQFIEGVLASPLIRTSTFADYHARPDGATRGVVYLPTTSYIEMNEWTLPPAAAETYAALVHAEKEAGRFEHHKAFLRGGIWRNFFSRYPESNWMHKRMLEVSARLAALPAETPQRTELQEQLHRAQANDAYWHGLFGGLYLPHLRRAIWNNLLSLEAALDQLAPRPPFARRDIDLDGREEISFSTAAIQAIVRADGDACVIELDSYPLCHNFVDTLRRHAESYHAKIVQHSSQTAQSGSTSAGNSPVSAHERIAFKQVITPADAAPDTRPRGLCVDTLIDAFGVRHVLNDYRLVEASVAGVRFITECAGSRFEKIYTLSARGTALQVEYRIEAGPQFGDSRLEIQLNFAMPSCDGYSGRYRLADGHIPCGFGQVLLVDDLLRIRLEDSELGNPDDPVNLGGALEIASDRPLHLNAAPHFTVSQSEAGFEKIMQAACLTLNWRPARDAGSSQVTTHTLNLDLTAIPDTPAP